MRARRRRVAAVSAAAAKQTGERAAAAEALQADVEAYMHLVNIYSSICCISRYLSTGTILRLLYSTVTCRFLPALLPNTAIIT